MCRSFGGPRNTHSGPGGRPSICCSCRFRRKYPPTMYWVLPARPFLFSFFPSPLPFFLSSSSSSPFRLFTFFHVAHVTGLLERGSRGKKGGKKRRRCIAAKVNEKKDRRARPAAFPNPILRFHGPPRKSLPASPPLRLPSPPFFRFSLSPRGGRVLSRGFLAFTFVLPDWRGEMMISFPFFFSFPPPINRVSLRKNEKSGGEIINLRNGNINIVGKIDSSIVLDRSCKSAGEI